MEPEKEKCIELNKAEYGEIYPLFRFPNAQEAAEAESKRGILLETLQTFTDFREEYNGTKYFNRELSPGCRRCGEGTWSCLFINNICNARCMFCPTPQVQQDIPATNTLQFPKIPDYIDYIRRFQFQGVSVSGGEPLLTFDRTMSFLTEIKKRFGTNVYMWMYTNGILLDIEKLIRLKYTGLDEIRFNLGAVDYNPEKVKLAVGKIPHVTVEIPTLPGDADTLKNVMLQLADMGVNYLNLHQLRCTPHNYRHLVEKGYKFLHGRKITILESELTALELVRFALEKKLPLAVNYCSFVYKNRYQALAPRRRYAVMMRKPVEDITASSYIRCLSIKANSSEASHWLEKLKQNNCPPDSYRVDSSKNRLFFNQTLLEFFITGDTPILLGYDEPFICPHPSFRFPYLEIPLNAGRKVVLERKPVLVDKELSPTELQRLRNHWASLAGTGGTRAGSGLSKEMDIYDFECTRGGLNDYY